MIEARVEISAGRALPEDLERDLARVVKWKYNNASFSCMGDEVEVEGIGVVPVSELQQAREEWLASNPEPLLSKEEKLERDIEALTKQVEALTRQLQNDVDDS